MATERIQRRIDRLLDQVEEAADRQDWEAVRRLAQQVFDLAPDDPDATTFLEIRRHPGRRAERELAGLHQLHQVLWAR